MKVEILYLHDPPFQLFSSDLNYRRIDPAKIFPSVLSAAETSQKAVQLGYRRNLIFQSLMAYSQPFKQGRAGVVEEEMPVPRRYSLGELMRMRDSTSVMAFDASKFDSNFSYIIKAPGHDRKAQVSDACVPKLRSGPVHNQSSNDSDDEMVYRGYRPPIQYNEIKWQLRRRDSSDRSSQPISAPTRLEAQKSENFQKFYRAVVSPTHVRVTAGGRIVPNIRVPAQPVFTWNAEKRFFEQMHRSPSPESDQQGSWLQGAPLHNMASYFPGETVQSSTEGGSRTLYSPNVPRQSSAYQASRIVQATSIDEHPGVSSNPTTSGHKEFPHEGIKISPPSQFDVSRPFMYNGQLVYPVPPGFRVPQNIPTIPNMLGNLNIAHPQSMTLPSNSFPPHLQAPLGNTVNPLAMGVVGLQNPLPNVSGFPPVVPPVQSQAMGQSGVVPLVSPSSLLAPALIASQQIQVLQQQLKSMETQPLGNEHQMDEQHAAIQRQSIQNQIFTLQSIFNASIGAVNHEVASFVTHHEAGIHGASQQNVTPNTWNAPRAIHGSENKPLANAGSQFTPYLMSTVENKEPIKKGQTPAKTESPMHFEPIARKRLTAAAAKAPPFQPRIQQPILGKAAEEKEKHVSKELVLRRDQLSECGETTSQIEARLLAKSSNWAAQPHQMNPLPMRNQSQVPILSKTHSMHQPANPNPSIKPMPSLKKSATVQGRCLTDFRERVPYLRGYPPRDVPLADVKPGEFLYSRKLTGDEIRAKHLYWGKAPRDAMEGLPKWDGRDFYPPSPVKDCVIPPTGKQQVIEGLDTLDTMGTPLDTRILHHPCPVLGIYSSEKLSSTTKATVSSSTVMGLNDLETEAADDKESDDLWRYPNKVVQKIFEGANGRPPPIATAPTSFDATKRLTTLHQMPTVVSQHPPTLLQGMLRNRPHIPLAPATGAMSPATARGFLPPYRGSAAASLAPSINTIIAPSIGLEKSPQYYCDNMPSHPDSGDSTLAENRPISCLIAASKDSPGSPHKLWRTKRSAKDHKDNNLTRFDQHTAGTGPVGGSEW